MKNSAEEAAIKVMERHITALNCLDEDRLAETLHFPHYRLVGSKLDSWRDKETYLTDFRKRAGENWAQSKWNSIKIQPSSSDKVHWLVQVVRFDDKIDNTIHYTKLLSLIQNNVFSTY